MKRLLAVFVAAVLCLSVMGVTALSANDYYVAGVEALCGSNWDPGDSMNKMTANADGTYSMPYSNVQAGDYEFKITAGNWDTSWGAGQDNYKITVSAVCDILITFDPQSYSITVTGDSVSQNTGSSTTTKNISVESVYVAGNGSDGWLNGAVWSTDAAANKMTTNSKVYTITYKNVPAGSSYMFKFAANGKWDDDWGIAEGGTIELGKATELSYKGKDIPLSLSEASDVTLTLDLGGMDTSTGSGAKLTVSVKAASTAEPETQPSTEPSQGADAVDPNATIKVYASVPSSWANPGVWAWDDNQKNAFDAWPGLAMTQGDDGWWVAEVPAWVQNVIVNANSGAAQTADLDMEKSQDMWIVVTVENGTVNGVIHYEKPEVTPETQPSTEATEPSTEATEPETQPTTPSEPSNGAQDESKGGVELWVIIVVLVVSAGIGVGGVLLYHKLKDKKNG